MQNKSLFIVAVAFLLACYESPSYAKITLPALFSDGMVLQQQASVPIWGLSDQRGVKITTSWNQQTYTAITDERGAWRVEVKTPLAGGSFTLALHDGEARVVITDVFVGEVWLASGQSNMAMPIAGMPGQPVLNSERLTATAGNQLIRFFQVPTGQSAVPLWDCEARWITPDTVSVPKFSAVAYQFALQLQERLGVPVGIIQSAYGGTKVEAWMDAGALRQIPELVSNENTGKITKNMPGVLFNAMINPLVGYGIKGVIWYQGEGNRITADRYADWMHKMIAGWRGCWARGRFPFYYVQIAPFAYDGRNQSAYLREAQLDALNIIPNAGMVVTMDVGSESTIHPPDKTTVATRLANMALVKTYGINLGEVESPSVNRVQVEGGAIRLSFDHVGDGLKIKESVSSQFEIAGGDRRFYPAVVKLSGKSDLIISSPQVPYPQAVRYAFRDWAVGKLYNSAGLPASSFRTDDW